MGIIICEHHGESGIVQMSKTLHELYTENKEAKIIEVIFNITTIEEKFIHYFSSKDDISEFHNEMDIDYFDSKYEEISGDAGSCFNCFKTYLGNNKVESTEYTVVG